MKKIILFLFFLDLSFNSFSQIDSSLYKNNYNAGKELIIFNKKHSTGVALELSGIGISTIAILSRNDGVAIFGGCMSFIGFIIELTSFKHIEKCGILLENNGISIGINSKRKRKIIK